MFSLVDEKKLKTWFDKICTKFFMVKYCMGKFSLKINILCLCVPAASVWMWPPTLSALLYHLYQSPHNGLASFLWIRRTRPPALIIEDNTAKNRYPLHSSHSLLNCPKVPLFSLNWALEMLIIWSVFGRGMNGRLCLPPPVATVNS